MSQIEFTQTNDIIPSCTGKIDFYQAKLLTQKTYRVIKYNFDKSLFSENDYKLYNATILLWQNKITKKQYIRAWREFFFSFGITVSLQTIEFYKKHITFLYSDVTNTLDKRYSEYFELFVRTLYIPLYNEMEKKNMFHRFQAHYADCIDCTDEYILWIYKRKNSCMVNKHILVDYTGMVLGKNNQIIQINIEHCEDCGKNFISQTVMDEYRKRNRFLVGNFRMEKESSAFPNYDLAEESPLHLSGYNVSQLGGLSQTDRQFILSRIIDNQIMSKSDVVKYLSYFIKTNESKHGFQLAVDKWNEDIDFVLSYELNSQNKITIKEIMEKKKRHDNR